MKAFRALTIAGTLLAYALATLGSWTRINGAGMACPDWPLCHGAVIPVLQGGVILEWLHRAIALVVSLLVFAILIVGWRVRKQIAGLTPLLVALAAAIVLQVALGGVTIFAANSAPSVTMHWGTAMLLLAVFCALAVVTLSAADGLPARSNADGALQWRRGTGLLLFTALVAYATMCAGAYVSSSGAGLACLRFPQCGPSFFGTTAAQAAQMGHRFLAFALVACTVFALLAVRHIAHGPLVAIRIAAALVALQFALGVLNVALALPPLLREAHAANAGLTFLAFVVATVQSAVAPRETRSVPSVVSRATALGTDSA